MHFGFGILLVVSTGIMPIEVGDMTIRHTYLNAMENCSKSEYQSLEVGLLKDPSKKSIASATEANPFVMAVNVDKLMGRIILVF